MSQATPYSPEEKEMLIQLALDHPIIDVKKTDARSIKKKSDAWTFIANEFNANFVTKKRTTNQLKRCWDRLKQFHKPDLKSRESAQTDTAETAPDSEKKKNLLEIAASHITYDAPQDMNSDGEFLKVERSVSNVSPVSPPALEMEQPFTVPASQTTDIKYIFLEKVTPLTDLPNTSFSKSTEPAIEISRVPKSTSATTKENQKSATTTVEDDEKRRTKELHNLRLKIALEELEAARMKRKCAEFRMKVAETELEFAKVKLKHEIGKN